MKKNILNDITSSSTKQQRTSPKAASAAQGVVRLARGIILKQNSKRATQTRKPIYPSDTIESPPSFEKALTQTYPVLLVLILLAVAFFN